MKALITLAMLLFLTATGSAQTVREINPHNMPAPFENVGALRSFDIHNVVRLSDYCNGNDAVDDTECMELWFSDGRSQGKDLLADSGSYRTSGRFDLFSGDYLLCSDAVFVMTNPTASTLFRVHPDEPQSDIYIGGCAIDVNNSQRDFLAAVTSNGVKDETGVHLRNMTLERTHIYDSSRPGFYDDDRHVAQRQYILLLSSENVLIRDNLLEGGGRIKAGRPGRRIVIIGNELRGVNDNGITVVDKARADTPSVSEDIFIHRNVIYSPMVSGIFVGADGEQSLGEGLRTARITVTENVVINSTGICILLQLPEDSEDIYATDNTCVYQTPITSNYPSAIRLNNRSAEPVTLYNNRVVTEAPPAPNEPLISYFVDGSVCMAGNEAIGENQNAHRFRSTAVVWIVYGYMEGDRRIDSGALVFEDEDMSHCFISPLAGGVLPERWVRGSPAP